MSVLMPKWDICTAATMPSVNRKVYMRYVDCAEYTVDATHNVLIMRRRNTFDVYLVTHADELDEQLTYMFGLTVGAQTYSKVVELALLRAPEYFTEVDGSEKD